MAERRRLDELRIDRSETPGASPWPRRLLLLGLSVLLVAIAAWWFLAGHAIVVETATVAEARAGGSAPSVLDASGYVVARRQATVASKVTGRLVEVTVEEGMAVKEGQILARLDDANVPPPLAAAGARELARARSLAAGGLAGGQSPAPAQASRDSFAARLAATRDDVTVAEREVALRRQDVEDTLIRAPFDGVATSKNAQPGEIVSPVSAGGGFTRTGIGTIVDMSSLEIEVDVNEAFIQRVRRDQPVVAKNFFANMAVDPEGILRIYPEFVVDDDDRRRWLDTRTGALTGRKV